MKLSEAIRLGAMLGPQLFGKPFDSRGGSCALGAAALSIGGDNYAQAFEKLAKYFPSLNIPTGVCTVQWDIATQNDLARLTREQIADWLVSSGYDCESVTPAPVHQEIKEEVPVCV